MQPKLAISVNFACIRHQTGDYRRIVKNGHSFYGCSQFCDAQRGLRIQDMGASRVERTYREADVRARAISGRWMNKELSLNSALAGNRHSREGGNPESSQAGRILALRLPGFRLKARMTGQFDDPSSKVPS